MKHESHSTTLETKSTTRDRTACSGSAAARRLPISWGRSMSDLSLTSVSETAVARTMTSRASELVLIGILTMTRSSESRESDRSPVERRGYRRVRSWDAPAIEDTHPASGPQGGSSRHLCSYA